MKRLTLGLLPPAGGSLTDLATSGQLERLMNYYFPAYLAAFESLFYFSYYRETLAGHTTNPTLLERVTVVPKLSPSPYRLYAFRLPLVAKQPLRRCQILRVFQATGAVPAMMARLLYDIPYVTTYGYKYHAFASVEGHRLSSLYLRLLEPLALRLAAGVIVTTQELVTYVQRFAPKSKIHLIPNGVDTARFKPAATPHQPTNGPKTVLFIGRLTPQKNLPRLLEALSILAQQHRLRLQVIGSGPLQSDLTKLASDLNVNCTFEGTVPHHMLPDHMNRADVFVLPSFIEGHPKVLIEAMSCGLPCVTSNVPGNRALLDHEKTGLLFDPTDVQQMAQQIERVLTKPTLSKQLGRAARHHVCANYDLGDLLMKETDLLQTLAEHST